jgi:hypothetical protein
MWQNNSGYHLKWPTEILNKIDHEFIRASHHNGAGAEYASMNMVWHSGANGGLAVIWIGTIIR